MLRTVVDIRVYIYDLLSYQDDIYISDAFVNEGPSMKRFRPRAMGRASSIIKRSCHLTLTLKNKSK